MRRSFKAATLGFFLLLAALTNGQASAETDRAAIQARWAGYWDAFDAPGYLYEARMNLQLGEDNTIEGSIAWTLRSAPPGKDQGKIGIQGIEHVRGQYDPHSRLLSFEGYAKDDPNNVIGLDRYRILLSEDGMALGGITWDNGHWQGHFYLHR